MSAPADSDGVPGRAGPDPSPSPSSSPNPTPTPSPRPRQIPLTLPAEPRFGREDFLVSPSNERAWDMIEAWPQWPAPVIILSGPEGAGKSHLAAIWARRSGAAVIRARDIALDCLDALGHRPAVLIEDAGAGQVPERELFHLINIMKASQGSMLMTARAAPGHWALTLPDLLSRLRVAPVVEIAAPDDALVRAVLVKLFLDRQLTVDTSVIEYVAMRIERSLGAARTIVDLIDREALSQGRSITRPTVAGIMRDFAPET